MEKRNINDFTDTLQDVFNFISISKNTKIIGSANIKAIHFISDYDLNENISKDEVKFNTIYNDFKQIFINSKNNDDIFITDFKCGEIKGESLRWSYDDIMKGSKNNISFNTALKQDAVCKLDIIVIIDNKITEITNNYFIANDKTESKTKILKSIFKSYEEYIKDKNYMKAMKRLYSYNNIKDPKNKQLELTMFFNSDIGYLNKIRSDFELVIVLGSQEFKPVHINIIKHNLQLLKYNLSFSKFNISNKIDKICKSNNLKTIISKITIIKNQLYKYVNGLVKKKYF